MTAIPKNTNVLNLDVHLLLADRECQICCTADSGMMSVSIYIFIYTFFLTSSAHLMFYYIIINASAAMQHHITNTFLFPLFPVANLINCLFLCILSLSIDLIVSN